MTCTFNFHVCDFIKNQDFKFEVLLAITMKGTDVWDAV
jgi:hypothetical protein